MMRESINQVSNFELSRRHPIDEEVSELGLKEKPPRRMRERQMERSAKET